MVVVVGVMYINGLILFYTVFLCTAQLPSQLFNNIFSTLIRNILTISKTKYVA